MLSHKKSTRTNPVWGFKQTQMWNSIWENEETGTAETRQDMLSTMNHLLGNVKMRFAQITSISAKARLGPVGNGLESNTHPAP